MASCGRAHAIKAAFLAGILLILLNLLGSKWDLKTPQISHLTHLSTIQWPKRTRLSVERLMVTPSNQNETRTEPKLSGINATNANNISNNNNYHSSGSTKNESNSSITASSTLSKVILKLDNTSSSSILSSNVNDNLIQNENVESQNKSDNNNKVTLGKASEKRLMDAMMKTFAINVCPPIPPNLDGPIEVDAAYETLADVEKRLGPKLLPGGWYYPKECTARDRVAIIVPYRDREHHLPIFLKNLHPFLMKQQIAYGVFIVEQTSGGLFNRAELMNIGFVEALKLEDFDCFVFHDVDLLPLDDRNLYTCPDQPRHMSVAVDTFGFKLPYSTIFGGVSAMTVKQFKTVNGFSNSFWGWGGEDDDMSNRLKHVGFHIARYPVNIARYTMLSHKKEKANPKRYEKLVTGAKRFDSDGLNSLKYNLLKVSRKPLYTWLHVEINQDGS